MNTPIDNIVTIIFIVLTVGAIIYSLLKPEGRNDPWDNWWIQ